MAQATTTEQTTKAVYLMDDTELEQWAEHLREMAETLPDGGDNRMAVMVGVDALYEILAIRKLLWRPGR